MALKFPRTLCSLVAGLSLFAISCTDDFRTSSSTGEAHVKQALSSQKDFSYFSPQNIVYVSLEEFKTILNEPLQPMDSSLFTSLQNTFNLEFDEIYSQGGYSSFSYFLYGKLKESSNTALSELTPQEAIDITIKTTDDLLKFKNVDRGAVFLDGQEYNSLSLDKQIATGFGDCNVFASLSSHIFHVLQLENPALENIIFTHSYVQTCQFHDYSQIMVRQDDQTYYTLVDVSRLDQEGTHKPYEYMLSELSEENLFFYVC